MPREKPECDEEETEVVEAVCDEEAALGLSGAKEVSCKYAG
jgi:hypothetical protein